jgi:hypothetical protein
MAGLSLFEYAGMQISGDLSERAAAATCGFGNGACHFGKGRKERKGRRSAIHRTILVIRRNA